MTDIDANSTKSAPRRLHELDGIRGWAAFCVLLFHIFWETFGVLVPGFRNVVTGFVLDGDLAVYIFFVLSGESLSSAYFAGAGREAVARIASKRYTRLAIPILATCLVVFALHGLRLMNNAHAGAIVHRPDWLGSWLSFQLSLRRTLTYSLMSVFTIMPPQDAVDPFLWTMPIELAGSVLVLCVLMFLEFVRAPRAALICLFAALLLCDSRLTAGLSCFVAGVLFADIRQHGGFTAVQRVGQAFVPWLIIVAVGVVDGLQRSYGRDDHKHIFAVLLLAAVFSSARLCAAFASRPSQFLGRLSFPIYLVQFPVLMTITSGLIVVAADHESLHLPEIWGIATISVAATFVAARAFEPVETFTAYVGNRIAALVLRPRGNKVGT